MSITGSLMVLSGMMVAVIGLSLLSIAAQIALAFCIYYDSKLCGFDNGVIWAVLSGFSTLAALVYLIYRCCNRNKPMLCPVCRQWTTRDYRFCPHCGQAHLVDGVMITEEQWALWTKRRKMLFVLWLVGIGVAMLAGVVLVMVLLFSMICVGMAY